MVHTSIRRGWAAAWGGGDEATAAIPAWGDVEVASTGTADAGVIADGDAAVKEIYPGGTAEVTVDVPDGVRGAALPLMYTAPWGQQRNDAGSKIM